MKTLLGLLIIIFIVAGGFYALNHYIYNEKQGEPVANNSLNGEVQVVPINHATAVIKWGDQVIYTDPTGGAEAFANQPAANIVLVTDIHGDHLSTTTLTTVIGASTTLVVPQAVKDLLSTTLAAKAKVLKNGESLIDQDFKITGVPMYNLPASTSSPHTKGRGNGYIIEKDTLRVYVAGDTSGTPEMKALTNIDIALVPMNLPYTMSVEEAAEAVLAFKPKNVYPYHYRGQAGLADVNKFKTLVNAGDPNITVVLLDWYPTE